MRFAACVLLLAGGCVGQGPPNLDELEFDYNVLIGRTPTEQVGQFEATAFGTDGAFWSGFGGASSQLFHFTGDFNGDGKTDFMYWEPTSAAWTVMLSTGSRFTRHNWGVSGGPAEFPFWSGWNDFSSQPFHLTGDFNGDGKTDFMYWSTTVHAWTVLLSTGGGWTRSAWPVHGGIQGVPYWSGFGSASSQPFHLTGDFNGDGKTDFMYWSTTVHAWCVLTSNGNSWTWSKRAVHGGIQGVPYWSGFGGFSSQPFHFTGDFDGDGKTDFMYWSTTVRAWCVLLSNSDGNSWTWARWSVQGGDVHPFWGGWYGSSSQPFHLTGDFNEDGKTDFMYWSTTVHAWNVMLSSGHSWVTHNYGTASNSATKHPYWEEWHQFSSQPFHLTGDFTGDGKTDFMYWGGNVGWDVLH